MGFRNVYGHDHSSNGWPMVDEGSCTWVTIPGTDPEVKIQIQNGQPLQILRAFVADINAYVEHVRDADTACWTAGNSVDTSNHLSGTAVDIDWDSHPFRVADAGWNPDQINTIRQILDHFEGTIFWGNDWDDPKDAMHFQLASLANGGDIDTYGNPHTQDFINRKIRADGFSTFRRGGTPAPPTPPPLSRADTYALAVIREGQRRGITPRGIQIALATCLVESNLTMYANAKVPESMNIPHDAVGSDGYSVGLFQQQVRQGANGQWWWGDAATCMDPTLSAGLFYDRLARLDYNGPNSPGSYAQDVQRSAFPYRYDERFSDAVGIYNRLANLQPPAPADTDPVLELLMSELEVDSWSIYATPGEPKISLVDMIRAIDAKDHRELVDQDARNGDPDALMRVARTAAGQGKYGNAAGPVNHAKSVLADIERTNPELLRNFLNQKGA